MAIITSIGLVALASMAAILINDYTRLGGRLDDGDDNFSVFSRPATATTVPVRLDDSSKTCETRGGSPSISAHTKEVARV
jgi:hypothetical protein